MCRYVFMCAVAIAGLAGLCGCLSPTSSKGAEASAGRIILSHDRRSGEHLEWSIPESRISKSPRWNSTQEQVPLSVRDALANSCSWVKRKTEGGACDLEEICIRPFAYESNAFRGIYYYKIMYGVRPFDNLPCIVLMDGSVVEPKSTWPK